MQLPTHVPGKEEDDGPDTWAPATGVNGLPGSRFRPGPDLAIGVTGAANQKIKVLFLCHFAFQIEKYFF